MSGESGMFDDEERPGASSTDGEAARTSWSAYSDYREVSRQAAQEVHLATRAYAWLTAQHRDGARLRAGKTAPKTAYIHSAAMRMLPELRANEDTNPVLAEILTRWTKDGSHGLEHGRDLSWPAYISAIESAQLTMEVPPWLGQFVDDIQQAAWEIGYLKAGQSRRESDTRSAEEQARAMFNE